jgi:hypothetical protein
MVSPLEPRQAERADNQERIAKIGQGCNSSAVTLTLLEECRGPCASDYLFGNNQKLTRNVASVVEAEERTNGAGNGSMVVCVPQSQAFGGFRSVSRLENLSLLILWMCYSWSGEFVGDIVGEDVG